MPSSKKFETLQKNAVFGVILLALAVQILVCRGLYVDGANFLVSILDTRGFALWDKHRFFNHILTQAPVVIALKLGVTRMFVLRYIFSTWLILAPALVWLLALNQLRQSVLFWPFVMLFAFVYFNSCFFAIGEYNLCFALFAFCLAAMLREDTTSSYGRKLLFFCSFLFPFNYPASLYLGGLLLVVAAWRWRQEKHNSLRWHWSILASLYVLAILSGVWEILTPRDPLNFASARNPNMLVMNWQFWATLFCTILVLVGSFVRAQRVKYLMAFACFVFFVITWCASTWWRPVFSCSVRLFISIAYFGLAAILIYVRVSSIKLKAEMMQPFIIPIFGMLALLALLDIQASLSYGDYLEEYTKTVNELHGLVPYEQTALQFDTKDNIFSIPWTYPLMSLVLRQDETRGIILNPRWYKDYQPFDPLEHIPDLSRYYSDPEASNSKERLY